MMYWVISQPVVQGTQTRSFGYDSLSRLRTATNPESGTVTYQYDDNGNLTQKTDARLIVINYEYDALNRNTTINYSNTSANPDITRSYDTATNGKGRLRESYAGGSETVGANVEHTKIINYDPLGRPLDQRQRFKTNSVWSTEYRTQRAYNLAGGVTLQTYPSERKVSYGYDNAGRLNSFTGNLGDGLNRTYSTEIVYSPLGGMTKEKFGTDTPLFNKSFYNSRAQLSEIRVGTTYTGPTDGGWERGAIINHYSSQCWGACNGSDNNGNLKQQDHWIPDSNGGLQAVIVQGYTYDSLNRLLRVQEGGWQQEYVYDRWGNRTIDQTNTWGTGINKKDFTVNPANNRLGVPAGQSGVMTYDNAGNLTNDTYTGAGSRVYDAENRMTKAWGGNNQWQEYSYNADGQRTRRKIDGVETWQVYGIDGELLAEYAASAAPTSPQKEYGYRNGQLLITASSTGGSSGLVGYWKFDENTGTTAADSSSTGNAGTLASGAGWGIGQIGSAVSLDGVNDYVQVGAQPSLVITSAASFSSWIYPTGPGSDSTYGGTILNKEGEYVIARYPNGTIRWGFANSNPGWNFIDTGYVAPLNQWTHIAVTYDNGTVKTYANGTLVHTFNGSGSIGDVITGQNDFRVGGRQGISQHFQGRIDEVRVYNRALTASEVMGLLGPPPTSGLKGQWQFDENTGTTAADSSGSGNTGTLTSGTAWGVGQNGSALSLDGVNDYVHVGAQSSLVMTSAASFSAWIYPTGPGSNATYGGTILNKEGEYVIARYPNGTIRWGFANSNPGWNFIDTGYVAPLNQWTHIAVTYDNGTVKTYANGTLVHTFNGSGSIGDVITGQNDFRVGGRQGISQHFQGRIDEVRVHKRALTASEVTTLAGTGPSGCDINWLVAEQLGTPRMIFDKTGSCRQRSGMIICRLEKSCFAGQGGRTTALGYTGGDGLRQQFTSKERDNEMGLDYFLARYYASTQGRFTSPDEFKGGPHALSVLGSGEPEKQALVYADVTNPQSLNKYQYTFNNPLRYVDRDGQAPQDSFDAWITRQIERQLKGEITEEEYKNNLKGPAVGAAAAAIIVIAGRGGAPTAAVLFRWATRNPDKVQQIAQALQEGAGGPPGLVLGPNSRLTAAEISTGQRLGKQLGLQLIQSAHEGAEYVLASAKNVSFDAMGGEQAFKYFGSGKQFFESITHHVNKSVNYVAIDLKGASKDQIKAIENFVSGLTEKQREKIIYVR